MRTLSILLILVAAFGFAGCTKVAVHADSVPQADYSRYRTWQWADTPGTVSPEVDKRAIERAIVAAVDESMADKGYQRVRRNPDLLVAYHVIATTQLHDEEPGISPASRLPKDLVKAYDEGTLILDIIDPENDVVIWRGWAIRALANVDSPKADEINNVVDEILAQYPND